MTIESQPREPEHAAQLAAFVDPLLDLVARATYTSATDVGVRDLVNSAEHLVHALEVVDADQLLRAAERGRWSVGCKLADMSHDGYRALGIFMLLDVCADHPEVTGPLIKRLADRLETALLDGRPAEEEPVRTG